MDFAGHQRKEKDTWLAMRFGCCASKEEVNDGRETLRANGDSQRQIVYDQPQIVSQPRAEPIHRPCTSQSMSHHVSQWVNTSRDLATRASSRASFSTLTRPRRSHSTHKARPSISRPTNFQHIDNGFEFDGIQTMVNDAPMPVRRNGGLRRLELSIYLPNGCGRLSPLPDFEDDEAWGTKKVDLEKPAQALVRVRDSRTTSLSSNPSTSDYLIQRKPVTSTSSVSHSRHSSVQSQNSAITTTTNERRLSGTTMATMQTPTLSVWTEEPMSSPASIHEKPTIRRSRTSGTLSPGRVLSRLPSPSRARANTAPSRPGSLRRGKTDVDEAIRELNTIVEERRASAYRSQTQSPALISRPPPSPSHHVPYIAPSMRMHVRSETLSDIGSALSAPMQSNKTLPIASTRRRTTNLTLAPPSRQSTMALCSNPITPPAPHTPTKSMSRLTTWLKRSISTSTTPTSPSTLKPYDDELFYKCDATTRPSTAGSRTVCHTRQESQESNGTATVTLFSSSQSASSMSSRSQSPTNSPPRKTKRVPTPLVLAKEKEIQIEAALMSGRSIRELKPPMSPHANLLRGMEISAKDVGPMGQRRNMLMPGPSAVGVAF
ncbi:hypothetical protein GQ44DRAFT_773794 [Phaeosphaeriaceae sp. PMI808]|nr:hypothetical protein GQ44DRAFT_773794 [Phaeosphaeriaceae sp. PMI808]